MARKTTAMNEKTMSARKKTRARKTPAHRATRTDKAMRSRAAAKGAATKAMKENRRAARTAMTALAKTATDTARSAQTSAAKRVRKVQANAIETLTEMRRTLANRQAARRRQAIGALGPKATTKAARKPVASIAENKRMGAPIRKRVEKRAQAMMAQGRRATSTAEGILAKARKTLRKATDMAVGIVEAGVDTMMS